MQNDQEAISSHPQGRGGRVMHAYKSVDPFAVSIYQSIKNTRAEPDVQTIDDIGPPSAPPHPFPSKAHRFPYPRVIRHPISLSGYHRPAFQPIPHPAIPPASPAIHYEPIVVRPSSMTAAPAARPYDAPVLIESSYYPSPGSRARSPRRRTRSRRRRSASQSRSPRCRSRSQSRRRSRSHSSRYHGRTRRPSRPQSSSPQYVRETHTDEEHSSLSYASYVDHRRIAPSLETQFSEHSTPSAAIPPRNSPAPSTTSFEDLDILDSEPRSHSPHFVAHPSTPHNLENSERIQYPEPEPKSPLPASFPASRAHPVSSAQSDGKEGYISEYPHVLSRASTPNPSIQTSQPGDETLELRHFARAFLVDTLPRQVYLHCLLRLPYLYFSRVDRIFQEADLTLEEIKDMALKTMAEDNKTFQDRMLHLGYYQHPETTNLSPAYQRLKLGWEYFIDNLMREWKTLNIISALLLSGILTMFQIDGASSDPVTRYMAFWSLLCALLSLLYGCLFIIRFSTMRKAYKAAEWALEARKHQTVLWNVWVMLAMPVVWLAWSILTYIICIMSFMWRVRTNLPADFTFSVAPSMELGFRIFICLVLGVGGLYGILIINTFRRYGANMDEAWKQRMAGYIEQTESPYSRPPPSQYYQPPLIIPSQISGTPSNRSTAGYPLPYVATASQKGPRNSPAAPLPRSYTPSRSYSPRRYYSKLAPVSSKPRNHSPPQGNPYLHNQDSYSQSSPPVPTSVPDRLSNHSQFRGRRLDGASGNTLPQKRSRSVSSCDMQSGGRLSLSRTIHSQDEPLPVPPRLTSTSSGPPVFGPSSMLPPLARHTIVELPPSRSGESVDNSKLTIVGGESRILGVGKGCVPQTPSRRTLSEGPDDDHGALHIGSRWRSGE